MLKTHSPGIYFGMSEEEYHADQSLSGSGMAKLKVSPLQYWDERLNPNKPVEKTTPFTEFGKAIECHLFEPERFAREYVEELTPPDGALDTVNDMKRWLEESGADYKKSSLKPELIALIHTMAPEQPIVELLEQEFNTLHAGKKIISCDTMAEVERVVGAVRDHKDGHHVKGGVPQISLFWMEGDPAGEQPMVPMKARLDWTKPAYTTDLKTFSNGSYPKKPITRIIEERAARDYLIQAFINTRGMAKCIGEVNAGNYNVHGEAPEGFLNELLESENRGFVLAFVESERPYNVAFKTVEAGAAFWLHIEAAYMGFLALWLEGMELCGIENEWRFHEGTTPLTDSQVPAYVMHQLEGDNDAEITV